MSESLFFLNMLTALVGYTWVQAWEPVVLVSGSAVADDLPTSNETGSAAKGMWHWDSHV